MIYAYIRVSTETQSYANQEYEIRKYCDRNNLTVGKWVSETPSGTIPFERRRLGRTFRKMKKGDLLLCTEISRLGRNMLMIMSILNHCSSHGIAIHTIKDNFDLSDSINSKIIAFAFALSSEIERNLISQRTREALAGRRSQGKKLGRPPGMSAEYKRFLRESDRIRTMLDERIPLTQIAKAVGIHRNTLRRYLDLNKLE